MKKLKFIFIIMVILLITGCSKGNIEEISYSEYQKLIDSKETFILEVMQDGCSACESFKPNLEKVLKDYNIEIKAINTSSLNDEQLSEFGISGTPTVIFYINGEEETTAARIIGSVSRDKIISKFKASGFIKE